MDSVPLLLVEYLIKTGLTYDQVSEELQRRYPGIRGLFSRSVRRYCNVNNIVHLNEREIDCLAEQAILEVGAAYGRRLMRGYLLSKGFKVSEIKISNSMYHVDPVNYEHRRHNTVDRTNPVPYQALYFGHKLHMDQNEKLTSFGVTSVLARDGYSGKIVSFGIMPIKNNIAIYDLVLRDALVKYGLWDQLRVDHGREFNLSLYVQDHLCHTHGAPNIRPFVQSTSTENLVIERIWVEINSRVNYPIKRILVSMVENDELNMNDDVIKFCVSFVTCRIVHAGIKRFIDSWNLHSIPGVGVPVVLAEENDNTIPLCIVPTVDEAVAMYKGQLTLSSYFGLDPLRNNPELVCRRDQWLSVLNSDPGDIFTNVISGNGTLFKELIVNCIVLSNRLSDYTRDNYP